jgi:hypothetical protein
MKLLFSIFIISLNGSSFMMYMSVKYFFPFCI